MEELKKALDMAHECMAPLYSADGKLAPMYWSSATVRPISTSKNGSRALRSKTGTPAMIDPFISPEDAHKFIVATAWFRGDDEQTSTRKADACKNR